MQILQKREREMTKEEKIKLDLTRILVIVQGHDIRDHANNFNFADNSPSALVADIILDVFSLEYKDLESLKRYFPEKQTTWPGEVSYEQIMNNVNIQKDVRKNQIMAEKMSKLRIVKTMNDFDKAEKKQEKKTVKMEENAEEKNEKSVKNKQRQDKV